VDLGVVLSDVGQDMRQPSLRNYVVRFGGDDEAVYDRRTLSSPIAAAVNSSLYRRQRGRSGVESDREAEARSNAAS
jgi:hypothetical protein